MQITLQLPAELEQQLTERAAQLNILLETLILNALAEVIHPSAPDDTPNEVVLDSLRAALEDVQAGRAYPIEELWNGIDG
ncbi:MAG: hypothetical protein AAGH67_13635 [Cyanobacteria bacterium P01_H01_bin.162]